MSYININPANQSQNQSGGIIVVPQSGLALAVTIVGSLTGTTNVDVVSSVSSDAVSTGTDALATQALGYGYYESGDEWARIRAVTPLSGGDAIGPFSGFALATAALIVDAGGRLANLGLPNTDTSSVDDPSLDVRTKNYGYNRTNDDWSRLPVTASGQGISGMQHRLGVAFSGDIVQIGEGGIVVDAQGSTTSDAVSTSDNALTTMALNYGFDPINGDWSRTTVQPYFSGEGFLLRTMNIAQIGNNGLKSRNGTDCTAASGGTVLSSNSTAYKVLIKNQSGNNTVMVGGVSGEDPTTSKGYELYAGQEIMVDGITNLNQIRICALTSGQEVSSLSWR